MAILSDRWIEHHAKNHNLITPFHSESKNHLEDGTPVTSYGLSSFGYDLSLGNSFRVFTTVVNNEIFFNANIEFEDGSKLDNVSITKPVTLNTDNLIIDPVNFNSDLTVLVENVKTIYIPPKGFMLGVAKERVKLARDFTGLCMEKSTLARCFTGDTKIALVDGTAPSFLEAIERVNNGERLFGYSVDHQGSVVVSELIKPRKIGTEKVIEVVLDSGDIIKCTPDHKFMTLEGVYIEAKDLKKDTSLISLIKVNLAANHKVVEIRYSENEVEDVYCLTAPEYGNFALEAGVFVKNCGLCVTVTPLEAGWEGYITLEISNKTDFPIKLTAGMGICQLLFFAGNEACEVSYSDRNGKYQNQPAEPVLPKRRD